MDSASSMTCRIPCSLTQVSCRATSADGNTLEPLGLRGSKASTPPPRDRISEYENARVKTPKKPAEGPLFEVIKSNRRPDDKSSAIAKLPNGE
jgi:hypothetical protein